MLEEVDAAREAEFAERGWNAYGYREIKLSITVPDGGSDYSDDFFGNPKINKTRHLDGSGCLGILCTTCRDIWKQEGGSIESGIQIEQRQPSICGRVWPIRKHDHGGGFDCDAPNCEACRREEERRFEIPSIFTELHAFSTLHV